MVIIFHCEIFKGFNTSGLTTHEIIDNWVDGAVEVWQQVRDQRLRRDRHRVAYPEYLEIPGEIKVINTF